MDSSYFMVSSSNSNSNSNSIISNDFEQPSAFNICDPFDGFSFLDQPQGTRFYDYLGYSGGRNSPTLINQYPLDQFDHSQLHHQKMNSIISQIDPNHEEEDDDVTHSTLGGFVECDLGLDNVEANYNSGVDLFSTNSIVDCSDSTEAYHLRLALEQNNISNLNDYGSTNSNTYSDINNLDNLSSNFTYDCNSYNRSNGDSNMSQTAANKRSVLMNLLIDGSDVGAGYTSRNCRALPQKLITQQRQHQPNIS